MSFSDSREGEPNCIKEVHASQPLTPSTPPLTAPQLAIAKKELINTAFTELDYPKVARLRVDPPRPGQRYCTYVFLPSKEAKPDSDGCYGTIKFRGSDPDPVSATKYSEMIIRDVDSYNENIIGFVGHEMPLCLDKKFVAHEKEVDVRAKVNEIAKEAVNERRKQEQKEMDDILQRQQELLADTTEKKTISHDDLNAYIELRVKRANLRMVLAESEKRAKECGKLIQKTSFQIGELDEKFPQHQKDYMAKYKHALETVGAPIQDNPMIKYMQ